MADEMENLLFVTLIFSILIGGIIGIVLAFLYIDMECMKYGGC